jgi:hypothetical protein
LPGGPAQRKWHHAALLTHIGTPALPFPNVLDHAIARVIEALASTSGADE